MAVVSVSSDGSIVIPKRIRDRLSLESGSKISVDIVENKVILNPVESLADKKGSLRNIFIKETAKELIEESRTGDKKHEKILEKAVCKTHFQQLKISMLCLFLVFFDESDYF
jgi:AbrB family looped-hinge helix DNA binding protein